MASEPDLIVAIDFGMTCTGVAYVNRTLKNDTIRWIQKWPGQMQAAENKVPTVLVYPIDSDMPSSWGFLADTPTEQSAENRETKEWFKTFLDESELRKRQAEVRDTSLVPASVEIVEKWYLDYFRQLYQYIQSKLQMEIASRWEDARVEFIFSVPTTWKPHPTVERFRRITAKAGFGSHPNHTSKIGLTEAEAAAVYMSKEEPGIFRENDILVVCDAGGGTSDLSALRVTGTTGGVLSLKQLDIVFGANLGSTQIDLAFQNSIYSRLEQADLVQPLGVDIHDAAWEMMKGAEYQNAKCEYGEPDQTDYFSVAIPKVHKQYTNGQFGILNGEMRISRTEIQQLFDVQITKLFALVDKQLEVMQSKLPNDQVAHLVLSGGLGNSAYVQQRLRFRYAHGASPYSNAANLQVRVAQEPQLVVCKGNVADRLQKLKTGTSILSWRCCRASYGTKCKVPYNPKNPDHLGRKTVRDTQDGNVYVVDVVDWFIKKGEPVSVDRPVVKSFRQKMSFKTPDRVFPVAVIETLADSQPFVFDQHCEKLCNLKSDFSAVDLKLFKIKNRHFWNTGEKYYRVDYLIKVVLGPADINFELWFNGQKLSKDEPIKVEWLMAAPPVGAAAAPNRFDYQDVNYMQTSLPTAREVLVR